MKHLLHLLPLLITALVFISCACSEKKVHWEMEPPRPVSSDTPSTPSDNDLYPKSEGVLRLVHYNVGAFNKSGSSTVDMIADMLTELHADIISMNEVDSLTTRTGRVDQPEAIAGRLGGWGHMFAKAMDYQGGGYGLSILHRPDFKPLARPTLHIPKGEGSEPRACGIFEFKDFVFATTHLDHRSDAARLEGVSLITAYLDKTYPDKPVFVCGDFNCLPESSPITAMKEAGFEIISSTGHTFSAKKPSKCIDYIFVKKHGKPVQALQSMIPTRFEKGDVTVASDHLPVFVDVKL